MSDFSKERLIRIWNDKTGTFIQVAPDSDGLDLVTISSHASTAKAELAITMTKEEALFVAEAIRELYE